MSEQYTIIGSIGSGSYGSVYKALDTSTNEHCAIKRNIDIFRSNLTTRRVINELWILHQLSHPNIVSMRDICVPLEEKTFSTVSFAMELMDCDLNQIITHRHKNITEQHIKYIMYQILCALHYLHDSNVIHGDLKPENILINSKVDIKLCDFGLSCIYDRYTKYAYVQTREYRAPEVILRNIILTEKIDLWSAGCIMAGLFAGHPLFYGDDDMHQIAAIFGALGRPNNLHEYASYYTLQALKKIPDRECIPLSAQLPTASVSAIDLLSKLLYIDPNKRITAFNALQHCYFDDFRECKDIVRGSIINTLPLLNGDMRECCLSIISKIKEAYNEGVRS